MPAMCDHYMQWGVNSFPDFTPESRKLISIAYYVCDMDAANYCMSNKQKLMLAMLIDGQNWRAHCRQAFRYDDGAWVRSETLSIDAWDLLMALEGLFVQVSVDLATEDRETQMELGSCRHRCDQCDSKSSSAVRGCDQRTMWRRQGEQ